MDGPDAASTVPDWLADPALLPVWQRLRGPLERGARSTRLTGLSRESRHALGLVLGRPITGEPRVTLHELDDLTRSRGALPLASLVVATTGPLRDRAGEAAARQAPLDVLAVVDPQWAQRVGASGLLGRLPDPLGAARDAVRVLDELPVVARLRTELAAAVLGDAHALDDGRPVATLVLRGLHGGCLPSDRRAAWESVGVLADTVSTTVLALGLHLPGTAQAATARGDPVHLTPWDLRRTDLALHQGPVLVVENPAVLEAFALRYGATHAVVCTAGWPATVAVELLEGLQTPLAYHGDLDWRGVEICGWLGQRCGVVPWRMTAADYLAAAGGEPLTGRAVDTPWDPELAVAMRRRGTAVHEEQLLDDLLMGWHDEDR